MTSPQLTQIFLDDNRAVFKEQLWWTDDKDKLVGTDKLNYLQLAAKYEAKTILKYLLDLNHFDIDAQSKDGNTALLYVMSEFSDDAEVCAKLLLTAGANPDVYNKKLQNATMVGIESGIHGGVVLECAEKTKALDVKDEFGYSVLESATTNTVLIRLHAHVIANYIRRGAEVIDTVLEAILISISDTSVSVMWEAIQEREDLRNRATSTAIKKDLDHLLPQSIQDTFIF